MAQLGVPDPKHVIDTHRHLIGPRLREKMEAEGMYDATKPLPQVNNIDLFFYRDFVDLEYGIEKQRAGGVTKVLASNGGEVEAIGERVLKFTPVETVKYLNEERLEIQAKYPRDVDIMVDAHALEEGTRDIIEAMVTRHGAKAISISSSYGHGTEQVFLDSPKAEWLWEFAQDRDILVHVHPPMVSIGHESLMQYRLIEAVGRPFDTAITVARLIYAGVFDKYPKLKILFVHMGGGVLPVLGRLDFNWRLNYEGIVDPPINKVDKNCRMPSEYLKSNIYVDTMGFNPIGVKAAIEMCGIDRVLFGTDYGPVPMSPREHIDLVNNVVPDQDSRDKIFWKNSNSVLRLGIGA